MKTPLVFVVGFTAGLMVAYAVFLVGFLTLVYSTGGAMAR